MNKEIVIMTPHPDDETLGCGGTILKHLSEGDEVYWIIFTAMTSQTFSEKAIKKRKEEINSVSELYRFAKVINLEYEAAKLDEVKYYDLIGQVGELFRSIQPNILYVPYRNDIHSDHKVVFDVSIACTKWFRYPSIEKVLVYETLSETDFTMNPDVLGFRPNVFVNITDFIDKKIEIMKVYNSEIAPHPFPRSEESIRALATLRGSAAGVSAAEAFMLLKERVL